MPVYVHENKCSYNRGRKKETSKYRNEEKGRKRNIEPLFEICSTNFKSKAYKYAYSSHIQWTTQPKMQFQEVRLSCKVSVEQYASISQRTPFELSLNTIQVITCNFHQLYNKCCNYKTDFLIYWTHLNTNKSSLVTGQKLGTWMHGIQKTLNLQLSAKLWTTFQLDIQTVKGYFSVLRGTTGKCM